MKKISAFIISIILTLGICVSSYAEIDMSKRIINIRPMENTTAGDVRMQASVYGFEETNDIVLRKDGVTGLLPELNEKALPYMSENDAVEFIEVTAFDTKSKQKITLSEKIDMQIRLNQPNSSGYGSFMGKDYRVVRINENTCTELPVVKSTKTDVTFNTDELGVFAIIYNTYAFDFDFYSNSYWDENDNYVNEEYVNIQDLSNQSVIELPEPPTRDGYIFAGWYQREDGAGRQLLPGMTLSEYNWSCAHAYWVKSPKTYTDENSVSYAWDFDLYVPSYSKLRFSLWENDEEKFYKESPADHLSGNVKVGLILTFDPDAPESEPFGRINAASVTTVDVYE